LKGVKTLTNIFSGSWKEPGNGKKAGANQTVVGKKLSQTTKKKKPITP